MLKVRIDLSKLKKDLYKIKKELRKDGLVKLKEAIATDVAVALDDIVRSELPPSPRKKKQIFTQKQRRWWWWKMNQLASGKDRWPGYKVFYKQTAEGKKLIIKGQYKRTGTMVRSLSYEIVYKTSSVVIQYGTKVAYARYVIDEDDQSGYHRGNWMTIQEIVKKNEQELEDVAASAAETFLKEVIN